jgi:hypothetical protein
VGDTFTKLSDPSSIPSTDGLSCAFSDDGVLFAVGHVASPYITIWKRNGQTFTRFDNPTTLPDGDGTGCAFSRNGVYLAVAHHSGQYITIYKNKISCDNTWQLNICKTIETTIENRFQ